MKISHLFFAFLCAATGWTHPNHSQPLGLFVKNNSHWISLTGRKEGDLHFLEYNNSSAPPSEFIVEDGCIRTPDDDHPHYVGVSSNMLAYGPQHLKTSYKFDHEMKILEKTFYICNYCNDSVIKDVQENKNYCKALELYLLPFERYTYSPIPIAFPTQGNVSSSNPLIFCIQFKGFMWPLSGMEDKRSQIGYLIHEVNTLHPIEVTYQDTYISTENTRIQSSVGFFLSYLSYGPGIISQSWELNSEGKIENRNFFMCTIPNNIFHFISVITLSKELSHDCTEVGVFVLRYDRKTRTVIEDSSPTTF